MESNCVQDDTFVYQPMIDEKGLTEDVMKCGKYNFVYEVKQRLPEKLWYGVQFHRSLLVFLERKFEGSRLRPQCNQLLFQIFSN